MQPRTYAVMLVAAAATLFVGVATANLAIDPQGVFGTGILHPSPNVNSRFLQFAAYRRASSQYEGLMLGSSRANVGIPLEELSRRTGVKFAGFGVTAGRLEDHILVLDFVLRQKRRDRERLAAVWLLLDIDRFGDPPLPVKELLQPPELTGDNPMRFWWRNLIVIQWRSWQLDLTRAWRRARGLATAEAHGAPPDQRLSSRWDSWYLGAARAQAAPAAANIPPGGGTDPITGTRHFADQLQLLSRIIALCREHAVELTVVVPPISRTDMAKIDKADLENAIERVIRLVPLWDFSGEGWLWNHPEFWLDSTHFLPEVGGKILARIFGEPLDGPWSGFGRIRRASAAQ